MDVHERLAHLEQRVASLTRAAATACLTAHLEPRVDETLFSLLPADTIRDILSFYKGLV